MNNKRLYVGNIKWTVTDDQLKSIFSEAGTVISANIILDRETGRSRGFGFVEMSTEEEHQNAIKLLNGKNIDGRTLTVNEARPEPNGGTERLAIDLSIQIGAFCKGAEIGNNYGFKIGEKHFTITCDK
jgi:RNA recognition motif-containing protein